MTARLTKKAPRSTFVGAWVETMSPIDGMASLPVSTSPSGAAAAHEFPRASVRHKPETGS